MATSQVCCCHHLSFRSVKIEPFFRNSTQDLLGCTQCLIRQLRLWKLEQEVTFNTSYGAFPDTQTGSAKVDGDRLEERVDFDNSTQ